MRKRVWLAVLYVLLTFCMALLGNGAETETVVRMEMSCGLEGKVRTGCYVPIVITLTASEDISGTVALYTVGGANVTNLYEEQVSLKAGESRPVKFLAPMDNSGEMEVQAQFVCDGTILGAVSEALAANVGTSETELLVGGLCSADRTAFEAVEQIALKEETDSSAVYVALGERAFPTDCFEWDMLDIVLLGEEYLEILTGAEENAVYLSAMYDWVRDGGCLILGCGRETEPVLALLERFGIAASEKSRFAASENDLGFETQISSSRNLTVECAELQGVGFVPLFSHNDRVMVQETLLGSGQIVVTAYDLEQLSKMISANENIWKELLYAVTSESDEGTALQIPSDSVDGNVSTNQRQYDKIGEMICWFGTHEAPDLQRYLLILAFYVLGVLPGSYALMAKFRKLQYFKGVVVISALLFALIIFLMGYATRFDTPFYYYTRIYMSRGGMVRDNIYLEVQSPNNGQYTLCIAPEYQVYCYTDEEEEKENRLAALTSSDSALSGTLERESADCIISRQNSKTAQWSEITYQNVFAFETQRLLLSAFYNAQDGIDGEVYYYDGALRGSLTNTTLDKTFVDVSLLLYGKYVCIGTLAPGETICLDGMVPQSYSLSSGMETLSLSLLSYKSDTYAARSQLLQRLLDEGWGADYRQAVLFAFEEDAAPEFQAGQDYSAYGFSIYSFELPVCFSEGGLEYFPLLREEPDVLEGIGNAGEMYYDTLVLDYDLSGYGRLAEVIFAAGEESGRSFEGSVLVLNQETQEYESLDYEAGVEVRMDAQTFEKYLTEDMHMIVCYEAGSYVYARYVLPQLSLIAEN